MIADREMLQSELVRLRPTMLRWLLTRTASSDLAEEVVQQALMKALERLHTLQQPRRLRAWFQTIVRNTLNDEFRRQQKLTSIDELPDLPALEAEEPESSCACVLDMLKGIRPTYASLLQHVDLQEQPLHRAATALGITANNAGVRLHRARQALKNKLLDACGTDSVGACQECACCSP